MDVTIRWLLLAILIFLQACAPRPSLHDDAHIESVAGPAADDGPATARHLQKRYDERVSNCGSEGRPAFLCSGLILMSAHPGNGAAHTWDPGTADQARGGISASWLRGDAPFHDLPASGNGIVFFPNEYVPTGADKIYVLCAFPYEASTNARPGKGCGAHPQNPGKSAPCQGIGIRTAPQWFAQWQSQPNAYQCGFDVSSGGDSKSAEIFMQIPALMAMLNGNPPYNDIVLQAWTSGQPTRRPIEAFFYLYGDTVARGAAQKDQRDFQQLTGTIVPIIRIRLPVHGGNASFDYLPDDQAGGDGQAVASELTRRYNDVSQTNCDFRSTPAFVCTGVIIRGTGAFSTAFHSWNPSPNDQSRQSVSAAFLRKDMKFKDFGLLNYHHGIIFYPKAGKPASKFGIDVRCVYPLDGGTSHRTDHGCGLYPGAPGGQECVSQGVTDAAKWRDHYRQSVPNPQTHMCGFGVAKGVAESAFYFRQLAPIMAMQLRGYGESNELVMEAWGQNLHRTIPIEAFFYLNGSAAGRNDSRSDQMDFYNTSAKDGAPIVIPVIRVTLPASIAQDARFEYIQTDQAVP